MFSFYTYFWNNDIYINEKHKYAANEILTAYLNTNYLSVAKDFLYKLKQLKDKLILVDDIEYENLICYNSNVYQSIEIFTVINEWLQQLPPYNKIFKFPILTFDDLLNYHSFFFEDGLNNYDEPITWTTVTEFGCGEQNEYGNWKIRIHKFNPIGYEEKDLDSDTRENLNELNQSIIYFFDKYIDFLKSYISIHTTFKPFVDKYLHRKETFYDENETAQSLSDFNKENGNAFYKIKCKIHSFEYKVPCNENSKPLICEELKFHDLQSFIYYDFFNGLKRKYIPNKCKNCGAYFLIPSGRYISYCNQPLENDKNKTCRDIGAKRRYDDKCKNDPIWQAYNRAYKAHYARYMKKKMTTAEFEQWSRYAVELRTQAEANKITLDDFLRLIKI